MTAKEYIISLLILCSIIISQEWDYSADIAEIKTVDGVKIKNFQGNVLINHDELQLNTIQAIEYIKKNELHLYGDVKMIDGNNIIKCDTLVYFKDTESCLAKSNVFLYQDDRQITSDTLFYWDSSDSIKAQGNIKLIQLNNNRKILANHMSMYRLDSLTQILKLSNSAQLFSISQSKISEDSPFRSFENKMQSENINLIMYNDTIKSMDMYGMAITDYHVIKDSILMGINNISGDSISMKFLNNDLEKMEVFRGAIGKFTPEGNNSKVDSIVTYKAEYIDYIISDENTILQKDAQVQYKETVIDAGDIMVNWETNLLDAKEFDNVFPVVSISGENPMSGKNMTFDLINRKGTISKGKTSFDKGYYSGKVIEREEPNVMHMHGSTYTSCELDHPHYYFASKKMKMLQGDKIIAKPITLYISDFPIITFPFAILPNKGGSRRSGWIMPSIGNSNKRGTFLQNLGYYFAPNDYMDLKFLFSLYDLKGINLKSYFRYNKRYKYNGNIKSTLKRDLVQVGDDTQDITNIFSNNITQDWDLHWTHKQTFDPYQSLNFDLTYITSNDFYTSQDIGLDLDTRLKQKIESSLNYSKSWPHQKNSFNIYLSESYDVLNESDEPTSTPNYYKTRTLPKITFRHNSSRIFKDGDNWYNNIYGSMSSVFTGNQKLGFYSNDNGQRLDTIDYNSGAINSFNLSMTSKVLKWFSITPNISLKESWIFKYKRYNLDEEGNFLGNSNYEYEQGFKRRLSGSASMSISTKLYGIIPFKIGSLESIRHVLSPSISYSYTPSLQRHSNYFQIDNSGEYLDYFSGSLVGSTPVVNSRRYSFTVRNDFQIKYLNNLNQSLKENILNWSLNTSYNPEASQFNWSPINSTIQAMIPNLFNINISMSHDLYKRKINDENNYERVNNFESFPRLTQVSASTDLSLSGNKFNYEESIQNDSLDFDEKLDLVQSNDPYEPIIQSGKVWDLRLRFNYSMYQPQNLSTWDKTFWVNSDIDINLSTSWKMTYSARFDIENYEIVSHSVYLFRPLHCWDFSFKWWPSGNNKGFILNIYVRNPDLRDIKVKSTGGSFFGL